MTRGPAPPAGEREEPQRLGAVPSDLLRELGVEADERGLLDAIRPQVTASMLRKIAEADYGAQAKGHLEALEQIARTGIVPQPLRWVPGEVLELTRWSEPDQPAARVRGSGWPSQPLRMAGIPGWLPPAAGGVARENQACHWSRTRDRCRTRPR